MMELADNSEAGPIAGFERRDELAFAARGDAMLGIGLDEEPRSVADHGDRLARAVERAHEVQRLLVLPQRVGADQAAGEEERVVILRVRRLEGAVHAHLLARIEEVDRAQPAGPQRHDLHLRPVVRQCFYGRRNLHLLRPVRREHRHPQPGQINVMHGILSVVLGLRAPRLWARRRVGRWCKRLAGGGG